MAISFTKAGQHHHHHHCSIEYEGYIILKKEGNFLFLKVLSIYCWVQIWWKFDIITSFSFRYVNCHTRRGYQEESREAIIYYFAKFVRKRVPLIYSRDRGFHDVEDFFPSALNISFYKKGLEGSKRAENGPNYTLPPHLQTKFSAKKELWSNS